MRPHGDALQDSWIIVLEKPYQYRGGPPACGWVGATVRHEAGHSAARKSRDVPLLLDGREADTVSPSRQYTATSWCAFCWRQSTTCPPTYREVVRLRDLDERPLFGVKYFCRSTSTILAGSDGCSFDDAPFGGRCCGF